MVLQSRLFLDSKHYFHVNKSTSLTHYVAYFNKLIQYPDELFRQQRINVNHVYLDQGYIAFGR